METILKNDSIRRILFGFDKVDIINITSIFFTNQYFYQYQSLCLLGGKTMDNKPLLVIPLSALVLFLGGCAGPKEEISTATPIPATATPASLFAYDASIPFDIKINSQSDQEGVSVTDLSYSAHDPSFSRGTGGRTLVYLVKPEGEGPFAGVIYLHWLGQSQSNRSEFLSEAVEQAKRGSVCLVLQGYFPWMTMPMGTEDDRRQMIGQVIELRRAVDFLLAQPGVEPNRLGFVGHDYGAMYGGVLAGVDRRLKAYVLIAATPSFADRIAYLGDGGFKPEAYRPLVEDLEPILYVRLASPAGIFFQFAKRDAFIPMESANALYAAASDPKKIEWYDDLHSMTVETARTAREDWLAAQLD
jgi:dienelactone hydrolase